MSAARRTPDRDPWQMQTPTVAELLRRDPGALALRVCQLAAELQAHAQALAEIARSQRSALRIRRMTPAERAGR